MLACSSTAHAVERDRAPVAQALQLLALEVELVLAQLVLGEHLLVRVDDHHALGAVDDEQLVLADHLPRAVQRHDGGDVEAARDHRGVRGGAAEIGDEARELVLLELHHVGRRQVVRDQDQVLPAIGLRRRHVAGLAGERLHHALGDLDHVGAALAQVVVLDLVELGEQRVGLHLERPLGVAVLGLDDPARRPPTGWNR